MRGTIQTSKRKQAEDIRKATEEYLAKGGAVYQAEPGESGQDVGSGFVRKLHAESARKGARKSSRRKFN